MDNHAGNFELYWLCGFIDGEGCLRLSPKKQGRWTSYIPTIRIANTHKPSVERVVSILSSFGIGCYVGNPHYSKGNRKPWYSITTEGLKRCGKILPILRPYLCTKQKQADLLLEFIAIRQAVPCNAPYSKREHEIYWELKALNFRGSSETITHSSKVSSSFRDDRVQSALRDAGSK